MFKRSHLLKLSQIKSSSVRLNSRSLWLQINKERLLFRLSSKRESLKAYYSQWCAPLSLRTWPIRIMKYGGTSFN